MKSRWKCAVRLLCATLIAGFASMLFMANAKAYEFTLVYDSDARDFLDEEIDSETIDFTDVMPGDTLYKSFALQHVGSGTNRVEFYFRPRQLSGIESGLFSQCRIQLSTMDGELLYDSESLVREAVTDQWVSLGEYQPGEFVELQITINVNREMTNEYMNKEGRLPFDFMAEDLEDGETPSDTIQTGDHANAEMWGILGFLALCTGVGAFVYRLKKSR